MWPLDEREHRLGLGEQSRSRLGLADRPRLDREGGVLDHALRAVRPSSSARSSTTTSAPCARSASAGRPGRRRRRSRSSPARPASTPASASSKTAACGGLDAERLARPRGTCPARACPCRCSLVGDDAVDDRVEAGRRSRPPRARRWQLALEETTARAQPGVARGARGSATEPSYASTPSRRDQLEHEVVLAVAEAVDRLGVRAGRRARPRAGRCRASEEGADAVVARLAVDVRRRSPRPSNGRTSSPSLGALLRKSSNICFHAAAWTLAVLVSTPSRSNRQRGDAVGQSEHAAETTRGAADPDDERRVA